MRISLRQLCGQWAALLPPSKKILVEPWAGFHRRCSSFLSQIKNMHGKGDWKPHWIGVSTRMSGVWWTDDLYRVNFLCFMLGKAPADLYDTHDFVVVLQFVDECRCRCICVNYSLSLRFLIPQPIGIQYATVYPMHILIYSEAGRVIHQDFTDCCIWNRILKIGLKQQWFNSEFTLSTI